MDNLQGLLEARAEVRPLLCGSQERLKDLIFLDIALDSTVRIAVERSYEQLKNAAPEVNEINMNDYHVIE
jgi:alpha-glucan, water dikinase